MQSIIPLAGKDHQPSVVRRGNKVLWPKSCPHCERGDLALGQDLFGWFRQCVQCGFLQELKPAPETQAEPSPSGGKRPLRLVAA